MANTIKLKRGSGSDPGSSDVSVGELVVRTDTAKLFTKNDGGSVVEVSGGVDDGDKGDITVSSSGATWTIDNDAVTFAKMQEIPTARLIGRTSGGTGNPETLAAGDARTFLNVENGATADQSASEILTLLKTVDGSGSGLDADTLDGVSSASFVRSDASDTLTGATYTFNSGTNEHLILSGSTHPYIRWQESTTNKAYVQWHGDGYIKVCNEEDSSVLRIKDDIDFSTDGSSFNSIYHEGNLSVGDGGLTQNNFTNTLKSKLDGIAASATNVTNNNQLTNGASYITASNAAITNKLLLAGGTLTGNLTIEDSVLRVGDYSADNYTEIKHLTSDSYGFNFEHDNASAVLNEQGTTNQALVLGDTNAGSSSVLFGVSIKQVGTASDAYVPKLTLTGAGALTLTSTCTATTFSGSGASLTSLNGSNISSGTVAAARLGSGTANSSSYLRGDGAWSTVDAGATGGSSDKVFWENGQTVTANYTIGTTFGAACNALSAGPITINSSVTVTIDSGDTWVIV